MKESNFSGFVTVKCIRTSQTNFRLSLQVLCKGGLRDYLGNSGTLEVFL